MTEQTITETLLPAGMQQVGEFLVEDTEITEDLSTRKALYAHMRDHHSFASRYGVALSKETFDQLVKRHEMAHAAYEANAEEALKSRNYFLWRWDSVTSTHIVLAHHHVSLTAEDIAEAGYEVPNLDKPLSTAEAAALKAVIESDFAALEQDIRSMAQTSHSARLVEIEQEWAAKAEKLQGYRDKRAALLEDFRKRADDLGEKAKRDGITLGMSINLNDSSVRLAGLEDAKRQATEDNRRDLDQALTTLRRQKAAALRTVALARITPEARKVLDVIPDAKTLMVQAASERLAVEA